MSTKRGSQHRRNHLQYGRATPKLGYSMTMAVAQTAGDLESAKKASHDLVIELAGKHRRGGVEWRIWPASQAADVIAALPSPETWQRHLEHCRRWPGGFLVIALCKSTRTAPVLETSEKGDH